MNSRQKTLCGLGAALVATVLSGGVGAAMIDELGLSPCYWYKFVAGQRSYGTAELNWNTTLSTGIDTDEGSLCAAGAKGGAYGSGFDYGTGDWTIVGRFRSVDADNVLIWSLGAPSFSNSSACLALASGGAGVITLSGCGGNNRHADIITATVPDASTAFHSYAIQRNGQNISLWVDGEKRGEVNRPNNPNSSYFQFGSAYGSVGNTGYVAANPDSDLAVADFRFYRTALSADDLKTLAYPPRDELGERPYVWFPFSGSLVQAGASSASVDLAGESVIFGAGRCGVDMTAIRAGGGIPSASGMAWGTQGSWTMLVMAKSENADHAVIFSTGAESAMKRMALVSGGTDRVYLSAFSESAAYGDLVEASVPDATTAFHLYAIQRNGDKVSLWVDGVKAGEVTRPENPSHNGISFFEPSGQKGGLRTASSAAVDDYRFYRKCLTAEQMKAIISAVRDELGETPVHWLPLNGNLASAGKREPLWAGGTGDVAFGPNGAGGAAYFVSSGDKPTVTNIAWRSRNWTVVVKARSTATDNGVIVSFGSSRSTASKALALTSCGAGKVALSAFGDGLAHSDLFTVDVPDATTAFHSYAIRRSGGMVSLFVDGVEAKAISRPSNPTVNAFGLGTIRDGMGNTGLFEASDVAIDDVRIYEQALSARELLVLASSDDPESLLVATASWTGAAGDDSAATPGNWACTNLYGRVVENGVPGPSAIVTLSGSVKLQVPASSPVEYSRIVLACALADDVDWSGLDATTMAGAIDLASHALTVRRIGGDVTIGDTLAHGQLTVDVPTGETVENKSVALTGGLKLVKRGAGTFVAAQAGQTYTGGTEVEDGVLKFGVNGDLQPMGAAGTTILVGSAGTLDLNGYVNQYLNPVVLAGGTWANTGANQPITANSVKSLTLADDAQVNAKSSISLADQGFEPSFLDLGGHTLTVNVSNGLVLRLMNCTATNGTVRVVGATGDTYLALNKTACHAETVDFDLTCSLAPYVQSTVHDLTLRSYSIHQSDVVGVVGVLGTFTTYTKKFQNIKLLHGSTLNLSNWTDVFSTASELEGRTMTFAPGAAITVDMGGRKLVQGQKLVSWSARPEGVTFRLDGETASWHGVVVQQDGLYVAKGLMVIVR